ncbi:hypothetical protein ACJBPP_11020, partial [Streptococcus suis]
FCLGLVHYRAFDINQVICGAFQFLRNYFWVCFCVFIYVVIDSWQMLECSENVYQINQIVWFFWRYNFGCGYYDRGDFGAFLSFAK